MKYAFSVGAYVGVLLAFSYIGQMFGGVAWIPFFVAFIPAVAVGAGFVYGKLTGAGSNVNSIDDAVSKGLEARRDVEDTNDE